VLQHPSAFLFLFFILEGGQPQARPPTQALCINLHMHFNHSNNYNPHKHQRQMPDTHINHGCHMSQNTSGADTLPHLRSTLPRPRPAATRVAPGPPLHPRAFCCIFNLMRTAQSTCPALHHAAAAAAAQRTPEQHPCHPINSKPCTTAAQLQCTANYPSMQQYVTPKYLPLFLYILYLMRD
jgi:hypothetical protein